MLKFEQERREDQRKKEERRQEIAQKKLSDLANNYQKASNTRILHT